MGREFRACRHQEISSIQSEVNSKGGFLLNQRNELRRGFHSKIRIYGRTINPGQPTAYSRHKATKAHQHRQNPSRSDPGAARRLRGARASQIPILIPYIPSASVSRPFPLPWCKSYSAAWWDRADSDSRRALGFLFLINNVRQRKCFDIVAVMIRHWLTIRFIVAVFLRLSTEVSNDRN